MELALLLKTESFYFKKKHPYYNGYFPIFPKNIKGRRKRRMTPSLG